MEYGKWQVFTEIELIYSCFNCKCTATTTASFCLKTLQTVRTEKSIVLGMRALHEAEAARCAPTQIPRTTQSELLTHCKELVDFFNYKGSAPIHLRGKEEPYTQDEEPKPEPYILVLQLSPQMGSCGIMPSSVEAEILLTPHTIEKFFQIHSVLDLKGLHLDSAWTFKDHAILC